MLVTVRLPNKRTYKREVKSDNQLDAAAKSIKGRCMFGKMPVFFIT